MAGMQRQVPNAMSAGDGHRSGAAARTWRDLWVESVLLSNTLVGRDKSMRAWQYLARMFSGLTDWEIFANLMRALSVSRKALRFYKPVKVAKAIEDVLRDPDLDPTDKALTLAEVGSDGVYALCDHVAFLQRIGGLNWLSPRQVDNLDRFIEFFWLTEVLPVICRELRTFLRLRAAAPRAKDGRRRSSCSSSPGLTKGASEGPLRRGTSETLLEPMAAYPSSAGLDLLREDGIDAPRALAAKRRLNLTLLFKAIVCDFPVIMFFLQPAAFKSKRVNKTWAGFLGFLASLISLHLNWPKQ